MWACVQLFYPQPSWLSLPQCGSSLGCCSSQAELPLVSSACFQETLTRCLSLSIPCVSLCLFPSPASGAHLCEQGCPVLGWQLLECEKLFWVDFGASWNWMAQALLTHEQIRPSYLVWLAKQRKKVVLLLVQVLFQVRFRLEHWRAQTYVPTSIKCLVKCACI